MLHLTLAACKKPIKDIPGRKEGANLLNLYFQSFWQKLNGSGYHQPKNVNYQNKFKDLPQTLISEWMIQLQLQVLCPTREYS